MNKQITLYFKPQNKYNLKGNYYTIYINKISNLNLSSLIKSTPSNNTKTPIKQPNITIPESTHSKLIMLLQNQAIILTKIQTSLDDFFKTNNEIQKLLHNTSNIKTLTKGLNL